ncbi:DNA damage-regulated autophagy modulator protein 2-like [Dermatophagoides pteronyssinus]|uniref:DNA damage-regulated autophagy modulator protein 2-like n=2 Tax=Dermatophagoides pteronyssinus TaxID=6956 RepID=A0A6P6YH47_DERPT|nr:DNA damage-regulated autophagy modulator protein 2-like [Dermatophagoides pteronyssinus]KAH9421119.1 DNA damage-regulated autophagy modulator protein [Dermatophagoides pteronyssinus]
MSWDNLHFLPLAVFVCLPFTFIISYIIAICLGHVEPVFPYISDTGTHVPESNIFAQALNMVAALVAITIYMRFKHVEQYYRDDLTLTSNKIFRLNRLALYFGILSSIGLSVVANFREIELFKIHLLGALMSFGFGSVYCWLQSWLSFRMVPLVNNKRMAWCRTILSVIITISFLITCVMGQISIHNFHGKDPTNWQPENGGYHTHVISTISEWIAAMALDFFILTYTREFQTFTVSTPRVMLRTDDFDDPYLSHSSRYPVDATINPIQFSSDRETSTPTTIR